MQFRTLEDKVASYFKTRIKFFSILVIIFLSALFIRLVYLQIVKYEKFKNYSDNNRIRIVRVNANRGIIMDRKGRIIVKNSPSYNLSIVKEDVKNLDLLLNKINEVMTINIESARKKIKNAYPYVPAIIHRGLTFEQVSFFTEHSSEFPGLKIDLETVRNYADGEAISHIIGYIGEVSEDDVKSDNGYYPGDLIGKTGIEKQYEPILRGTNGAKQVEVDSLGQIISVSNEKEPVPGNNIVLSIDFDLQKYAKELLNGKKGGVVVLDIASNDVMLLYSSPAYDLRNFVPYISEENWKNLHNESRPLTNRVIEAAYPPGSVFKILMAMAALKEKTITLNTKYYCTGKMDYGNFSYRCWKKEGHGEVDLIKSIAESCDVFYYNVGLALGIDKIAEYSSFFNLGSKSGIDLPNERKGIFPDRNWKKTTYKQVWFPGETIITSIGQGYMAVTPIQVAVMLSGVFNGGKVYQPKIVSNIVTGKNTFKTEPKLTREMEIPDWITKILLEATHETVHGKTGTAYRARVEGINVGGKTGTAQVVSLNKFENSDPDKIPEKYRDHSWFGAVFPTESPKYVLVSFIEHGGSGSYGAAPIAGAIINKMVNLGYVANR